MVHRVGIANLDIDGLNQNACTGQHDDIGASWHDEVDEKMVPRWHASAFLCCYWVLDPRGVALWHLTLVKE